MVDGGDSNKVRTDNNGNLERVEEGIGSTERENDECYSLRSLKIQKHERPETKNKDRNVK